MHDQFDILQPYSRVNHYQEPMPRSLKLPYVTAFLQTRAGTLVTNHEQALSLLTDFVILQDEVMGS